MALLRPQACCHSERDGENTQENKRLYFHGFASVAITRAATTARYRARAVRRLDSARETIDLTRFLPAYGGACVGV